MNKFKVGDYVTAQSKDTINRKIKGTILSDTTSNGVTGTDNRIDNTNPKDLLGIKKCPLDLIPETANILEAMVFKEGARKYGAYNWRGNAVKATIYYAAMRRHMMQWFNNEDIDAETGLYHLASVRACAAILLDARYNHNLIDDRPEGRMITDLLKKCEEE